MIRKSLSLLAITFVFAAISCKQESAADKITDEDMKAIQEEENNYVKMPNYYSFIDKRGIDRKEDVLMTNFRKINKEVELIVNELIK